MSEVLLVTGMSGAGRSTASAALEDLGWFVIDNLPVELAVRVGELATTRSVRDAGVAFVVGRSADLDSAALLEVARELRERHGALRILFLDAPDDVLIARFEGNRRRHPIDAPTLAESIAAERALLAPIRDAADLVIDTGGLNVNQLRRRVIESVAAPGDGRAMRVSMVSFGFAFGIPRDVDLVFDCRFLPNPHWVEELRPLTGLDAPVAQYVLAQEGARRLIDEVVGLLEWQIPAFAKEGKSYLSIAVGCTGGRHRSVAVAEEIARRLGLENPPFHRDITR